MRNYEFSKRFFQYIFCMKMIAILCCCKGKYIEELNVPLKSVNMCKYKIMFCMQPNKMYVGTS